jgi:hypothetical protein
MRLGDFVVITGVPGLGKSTFANDLCCRVAYNHGLKIGWASLRAGAAARPPPGRCGPGTAWRPDARLDVDPVERVGRTTGARAGPAAR